MEFNIKTKILILVLAACVAFPVVFTETVTVGSLDHDCTDIECSPCLQIEAAEHFQKTFKQTGRFLLNAVNFVFLTQTFIKNTGFISCLFSPIALKVRFNS